MYDTDLRFDSLLIIMMAKDRKAAVGWYSLMHRGRQIQ